MLTWWNILLLIICLWLVCFLLIAVIVKMVLICGYKAYAGLIDPESTDNSKASFGLDGISETIKVLQFNVFWRPNMIHMGTEEWMRERSEKLVERIDDYDIVCLSEAFQFGSSINRDFVRKAAAKGFIYAASPPNASFFSEKFVDSGLLILSKYPIIRTDSVKYSASRHVDRFADKSAIYVKIKAGDKYLHVFATHLQASYKNGNDDYVVREQQLLQLKKLIEECVCDNYPIIICGDMNINGRKKVVGAEFNEYDSMLNILNTKDRVLENTVAKCVGYIPETHGSLRMAIPRGGGFITEGSGGTCLDYIFLLKHINDDTITSYNASVNEFKVDSEMFNQLSDHYATQCTFNINRSD